MKTTIEPRTAQQLGISPQLQHAIGLLQLSTPELEQELRDALDKNVFLEAEEPADAAPANPSSGAGAGADGAGAPEFEQPAPLPGLRELLNSQLDLARLSERDRLLADLIVDALDDDGYLTLPVHELAACAWTPAPSVAELEAVRGMIQNLEPTGCGSVDLGDCLRAQLRTAQHDAGMRRVIDRLTRLPPADWLRSPAALARQLHSSEAEAAQAVEIVRRLDPYPGRRIAAGATACVAPDVLVSRRAGRWVIRLNDQVLPSLRLNRTYEAMMGEANGSAHSAMQGQLQEARWLVKSVRMRNQTLLKVAGAIVARQQKFLDEGEVAMRPMVLGDIAAEIEMHESTISRVTTAKYIHTPRGMFELKYFFSSRLTTRDGGRCSSTAVRALMRRIVGAEDPLQPLSDGVIARLMSEQGIRIARRTVAKYRESLGIPPMDHRVAAAGARVSAPAQVTRTTAMG